MIVKTISPDYTATSYVELARRSRGRKRAAEECEQVDGLRALPLPSSLLAVESPANDETLPRPRTGSDRPHMVASAALAGVDAIPALLIGSSERSDVTSTGIPLERADRDLEELTIHLQKRPT